MRLFYASYLTSENMHAYENLVDRLQQDVPGALRPIPTESHHLTLVFLGEIPDDGVEDCIALLDAFGEMNAFAIGLDKPHVLMGRGRPRLICTRISRSRAEVADVQALLVSRLSKRFPALDLRPKTPHVTLARFHKRARRSDARLVREALAHLDTELVPHQDRLDRVHLVSSSLTPGGPVYETVAKSTLREEA